MADKRMFAKSIIESDPFMDMPAEAQMLYIHLNMAADDDGFVDKPRTIMRSCGASNDSMKLLIAKKFVLAFDRSDNFLVVIKHWRLNNYIRKDTYHETKYKEFMRELYYDENRSYSLNPGDGHVPCLAGPDNDVRDEPVSEPSRSRHEVVSEPSTQVRLGKSKGRLGEERLEEGKENLTSSFEEKESKEKEVSPERAARLDHFVELLRFAEQYSYDKAGTYRLAESEGISQSEILEWRSKNEARSV